MVKKIKKSDFSKSDKRLNMRIIAEFKDTGHPMNLDSAHLDIVTAVKFSDDGKMVLTGSYDKSMKLWIIDSSKNIIRDRTFNVGKKVYNVDFSPTSDMVLAVALGRIYPNKIIWWKRNGDYKIEKSCNQGIFFHRSDLQWIRSYSKGYPSIIQNYDIDGTLHGYNHFSLSKYNSVFSRFSWDGNYLLVFRSNSRDREADIYNANTGAHLFSFDAALNPTHHSKINDADISYNGRYIVTSDDNYHIYLWKKESESHWLWKREFRKEGCHNEPVLAVAISPQQNRILTGGKDGKIVLWDLTTGEDLAILEGFNANINDISYSAEGKYFIVASGKKAFLCEIKPK